MRRRSILVAAAGAAMPAPAQNQASFAKTWLASFIEHWKDTREYTLAVLDAMPAEGFTLKPDPAQRNFGEQMIHLGAANVAYFQGFGLLPPPAMQAKAVPPSDKDAVRRYVAGSCDYVAAVLAKMSEKEITRPDVKLFARGEVHSATDVCLRAYMHTAHHRGQAIVYLRVKGITPPAWKFEPKAG